MKLAALFSGGKDSTFAVYYALSQAHTIKYLLTIKPKNIESRYWHYPNIEWTKLQSKALNIPRIEIKIKDQDEIIELEKILKKLKTGHEIDGLLTGVIYSDYQRERLLKISKKVGLKLIAPLWRRSAEKILEKIIQSGFKSIIVAVAAYGLDETWLGRELNMDTMKRLKEKAERYQIHICGEGGEYETFVYDAPIFKDKIKIKRYDKIWTKNSGFIRIKEVEITTKSRE